MLDLNHPQSEHIFVAARLEGVILDRAKRMTFASAAQRQHHLVECQKALDQMRRLNLERFHESVTISRAITDLDVRLQQLAEVRVECAVEKRSHTEDRCPVCGHELTNIVPNPRRATARDIYCGECLKIIMPALGVLRSSDGFGTVWI